MAIESLKQPRAKMTSFDKLMNELPNGMNNLYRQALQALQIDDRQILLVALRWLLCGEGEIDVMLVADELEHVYEEEYVYEQEEYIEDIESRDFALTNDPSVTCLHRLGGASSSPLIKNSDNAVGIANQYNESSRVTIDELKRVGREFLKFNSNIIGLQHNSVRHLIVADEKQMQRQSYRCPECAERFNQPSTHQASPNYGHLLMVGNMLRKLNSPAFQKKFILIEDFVDKEDGPDSRQADDDKTKTINDIKTIKPAREDKIAESTIELDNATDVDPNEKIPSDFTEPPEVVLRYELTH